MPRSYSTYEAKARFSEVLRQVRAGESVTVTYRGEAVAEIRPLPAVRSQEERLRRLEESGVVEGAREPVARPRPVVRGPGALRRFLESRE